MNKKLIIKFFLVPFLLILMLSIYLATNVSKKLYTSDIILIESLNLDTYCLNVKDFKEELACIKKIQEAVFSAVPFQPNYDHLRCNYDAIPVKLRHVSNDIEPSIYLKNGYGCCNVKSRFIEKTLIYYNFNVRHLAIYRVKNYLDFFTSSKNTISHSSTEVMTSKGWMYVDSVDNFVGITKSFKPITSIEYLRIDTEKLTDKFIPSIANGELYNGMVNDYDYWNMNHNVWNNNDYKVLIVYGLHSRHGIFYDPKFKANVPDISWSDFIYNYKHLTN